MATASSVGGGGGGGGGTVSLSLSPTVRVELRGEIEVVFFSRANACRADVAASTVINSNRRARVRIHARLLLSYSCSSGE